LNSGNGMAVESVCRPSPQPPKKDNDLNHCSTDNYNPNVNKDSNTIPTAETRTLELLRKSGFHYIQQLDNIAKNEDGNWLIFEIKERELFTPGTNFPHFGTGLDHSQLYLRTQLLKEKGLRTYLLVFVKETDDVYGAFLDDLEQGDYYDTRRGIRIYPIDNFTKLEGEYPLKSLGTGEV
jgi:hypothetical protein